MNKGDMILVGSVLLISGFLFLGLQLQKKEVLEAYVYFENDLVLTIDLRVKEKKEYVVKGALGDVFITSVDGKVKVEEENSPYHLCSKQGYIKESYESIVCLPNKIVIKMGGADEKIDAIVK